MAIIRFRSNCQDDIDWAREHNVWQSDRKTEVNSGDFICLQLTGTKDTLILGRAVGAMYEDAPYNWPSLSEKNKGADYNWTVKFEPLSYLGQWSVKRED